MTDELKVGDVLGRYRIADVLGRGAMGIVYKAHDRTLGRVVALKILNPQLHDDAQFRRRFAREARMLSYVNSPHVVQIYDQGEAGGRAFIVSQFVDGQDLRTYLNQHGPLAPSEMIPTVVQVCDALEDAHHVGVAHRDIKPSNVLIRDAPRLEAYLCDFGIATTRTEQLTQTGAAIGTWPYMAPERFRGVRDDPRSDIYAVGCLMFEMLTGRPPFEGNEAEVAFAHLHADPPDAGIEEPLARIILSAMAKDPDQRFQTAAEVREALASAGQPPRPTSDPPVSKHAADDLDTGPLRDLPEITDDLPTVRGTTPITSVEPSSPTAVEPVRPTRVEESAPARRRPFTRHEQPGRGKSVRTAAIIAAGLLIVALVALALAVYSISTRADRLAGLSASVHRADPAQPARPTALTDFRGQPRDSAFPAPQPPRAGS